MSSLCSERLGGKRCGIRPIRKLRLNLNVISSLRHKTIVKSGCVSDNFLCQDIKIGIENLNHRKSHWIAIFVHYPAHRFWLNAPPAHESKEDIEREDNGVVGGSESNQKDGGNNKADIEDRAKYLV